MLTIRNLTKTYKGGKTTALKCVAGIHDYEQGEILIDGISLKEDMIGCKERLAYIPDNPDLYEYLTGIQYLNFIADIFKIDRKERERRIAEEAEAFEMTNASTGKTADSPWAL